MSEGRALVCDCARRSRSACEGGSQLSQDLSFSKHSAVISAFGQHFVKTGILDSSFHRHLLEAFDLRNLGDHGAVHAIDAVDARPQC